MDNISNLTSANNITQVLNSNNVSITDKTIYHYIEYLCNAFAFYKIKRYDIISREIMPLLQIKDAYPKLLISGTKHDTYQYEGIEVAKNGS